jgi:2-octaprenyl-6-methoxyphenol hydroxylase
MAGNRQSMRVAVVGAGPVGLATALLAARHWHAAEQIALFDARAEDAPLHHDKRTLALSLGSVQTLQRLGVWPLAGAAEIQRIHISQTPGTAAPGLGQAAVRLDASDLKAPLLGAVMGYGTLLAPLQAAWLAAVRAQAPGVQRLQTRFGTAVAGHKALPDGRIELDAGIAEAFDLVVLAEGGVFDEQAARALRADYGQTAWVGSAVLEGGEADAHASDNTLAFERFTRQGPLALLPLPRDDTLAAGQRRMAIVWCVESADDPVAPLDDTQRLAVLNTLLPAEAGRVVSLYPLKGFALGLNAQLRNNSQGRLIRIGNAAQTLHPVAGQGLNLGLRDAESLVHALRDTDDLDATLARIAWTRAPDRLALIASTDFLARAFTWQAPGAATLRALGLAALDALPGLKGAVARGMMFGWR